MTEKAQIQAQEVKLSFPYIKNNSPSFSNAVLLNMVSKDAFILDFGFFDPLSMKGFVEASSLPSDVDFVSRILLTRDVAENLLNQLNSALNASVTRE